MLNRIIQDLFHLLFEIALINLDIIFTCFIEIPGCIGSDNAFYNKFLSHDIW